MKDSTFTERHLTLLNFLNKPLEKKVFVTFFNLSYHLTKCYLINLHRRGYTLPVKNYEQQSLDDLTIDILGGFLRSKPDQPYYIIFDYLRSRDCFLTDKVEPEKIYDEFTILLRGFIQKEISKLIKEENPQIANLKRRFKEILHKGTYYFFTEGLECICLASKKDELRKDEPALTSEELRALVLEAFYQSKTRTEWCRNIFELIDRDTDHQNYLKKHQLLSAVIAVNIKQVELEGTLLVSLSSPQKLLLKKAVDIARKETLTWVDQELIKRYHDKGKITSEIATQLLTAADKFLSDFGHNSDTDAIPQYFREVIPQSEHKRYLEDYKYVFETLINKALDDFKKRLKENSTVKAFGNYYNIE